MNPPRTADVGGLKRHHGIFIALLLLLSFPRYSCGQETATLVDEAATADGDADFPTGDVTDLGDVVGDAMPDLTDLSELVEDLDLESVETEEVAVVGAVDDVDDNTAEEEESAETSAAATSDETADTEAAATPTATDAETTDATAATDSETQTEAEPAPVVQSGPYIDLLGDQLLSLEMVSETQAQVHQHYTNEALGGKKVVGLYFSADWYVTVHEICFFMLYLFNFLQTAGLSVMASLFGSPLLFANKF